MEPARDARAPTVAPEPLPRLPDRLRRRRPLPGMPQPARRHPSRARPPRRRPPRLRRLLRLGREARRPEPPRPAGDHRRRPAGRRLHRLLHRPHPRRALGDADVPGAEALPRGGGDPAADGALRRGQPRHPGDDARAHPAGGAAVARRGVPRPLRDRAAPSRAAGGASRRPAEAHRDRARGDRLGRALAQQVPREDRLRPRQATRLQRRRPRRDRRLPRAEAGRR